MTFFAYYLLLKDLVELRINVILDGSIPIEPLGLNSLCPSPSLDDLDEHRIPALHDDLIPLEPLDSTLFVHRLQSKLSTSVASMSS